MRRNVQCFCIMTYHPVSKFPMCIFQEYAKVCNYVVWATSMFQRNLSSLSPTLYNSLAVHCLITFSCHVWGQNFYHKLHANSLLYCNHEHIYDWANCWIESNLKMTYFVIMERKRTDNKIHRYRQPQWCIMLTEYSRIQ